MVVCGASAIFVPLAIQKSTLLKEFPFSIFCALLLLVLGYTSFNLGRMEGIVLLVLFLVYLLWMIFSALKNRQEIDEDVNILPTWKCLLFIIGGAIAIKYGGDFVVDGASFIATKLGFSQNLIGLTIVALGTSLPELVTSIVAARKNEVDMALGNAIGSNIFNILLVLGIAGAISPVAFIMENVIDIVILTIMSAYVWILAWTKNHINKTEGISMILIYVIYLVYICIR